MSWPEGSDEVAQAAIAKASNQADAIDEAMNNRNSRPIINVYEGFLPSHLATAHPVVADCYGRLWAYHEDDGELRMIHDPEAARC